ncbi:MAG: hypothetical protein AAF623_16535 [Planctomycetota bacterium]
MRVNLHTDPRVFKIAGLLNMKPVDVVGRLHAVWSWADAHSIDGNAVCVTVCAIDGIAGATPGFGEALKEVGWLCGSDENLSFPNFHEHNGQTAKRRANTAKRVAKHKSKNGNAKVTQSALPREEKRRYKKSKQKKVFSKPSVEDVQHYANDYQQSKSGWPKCPFDAQAFHDHYEANGWKVGRNSMKDWKAAVRNWGGRAFANSQDANIEDTARRL